MEVETQLELARRLGFLNEAAASELGNLTGEVTHAQRTPVLTRRRPTTDDRRLTMHAFHEYLCQQLDDMLRKHSVVEFYDPRREFLRSSSANSVRSI